jgi:hypothetical protein
MKYRLVTCAIGTGLANLIPDIKPQHLWIEQAPVWAPYLAITDLSCIPALAVVSQEVVDIEIGSGSADGRFLIEARAC